MRTVFLTIASPQDARSSGHSTNCVFASTEYSKRVPTTAFYDEPPGVVVATCDLREALLVNNTHVRIRSDLGG